MSARRRPTFCQRLEQLGIRLPEDLFNERELVKPSLVSNETKLEDLASQATMDAESLEDSSPPDLLDDTFEEGLS